MRLVTMTVVHMLVGVAISVCMAVARTVFTSSGAVGLAWLRSGRRSLLHGARCCHGAAVLPLHVEVGDESAGVAAKDLRQVHAPLLAWDHLRTHRTP